MRSFRVVRRAFTLDWISEASCVGWVECTYGSLDMKNGMDSAVFLGTVFGGD